MLLYDSGFHQGVESNSYLFWFCIIMLSDWSIILAPLPQPIRRQTSLLCHFFPALCADYLYLLRILIGSLDCLCPYVIGQCDNFGFGVKTRDYKLLYLKYNFYTSLLPFFPFFLFFFFLFNPSLHLPRQNPFFAPLLHSLFPSLIQTFLEFLYLFL